MTFDVSVSQGGTLAGPGSLESEVRAYSRTWPVTFARAAGSLLYDAQGHCYLDFFAGAGALNYGHNNPYMKDRLIAYLRADGVAHGLDTMTEAKSEFLTMLHERVLRPRALDYKVQFTGPTGTSAVESALKLARKVTGRQTVVAFTRAFHGVSLGSLAVTGNAAKRAAAGVALGHVLRIPFEGHGDRATSGLVLLEDLLADAGSGVERPAAVIVETVQAEGGVNVASPAWLRRLAALCQKWSMLLVVDDVQAGCGRTGGFFSFEEAGVVPDIVCLSKSISGFGLPMALTLFKRTLDVWRPGEDNGTFRGNNLAFVTATAALDLYWRDKVLEEETRRKGNLVSHRLAELCHHFPDQNLRCRGRGLIWGIEFEKPETAAHVSRTAFERGLLVETSGPRDEVVKLIPPLTTSDEDLDQGLSILADAVLEQLA